MKVVAKPRKQRPTQKYFGENDSADCWTSSSRCSYFCFNFNNQSWYYKVNILILVLMILQMPWNFFGMRGHADADTDSSVNDADVADVYAFDIAGV